MVFRYGLKDPDVKLEKLCDSITMNDLQCFVAAQFTLPLQTEADLLQKNLPFFALAALSRNERKKLHEEELLPHNLDQLDLNDKIPAVASRSGNNYNNGNHDGTLLPGLQEDTALDILAWSSRSDYPNLACVNKKLRDLIGSGYLYRLRRQHGIVEHWIYLACILMPWEAFDPGRQRWMRLPRIPCDECFTYADKESLAVGTELLVFGRELSGLAIWKYSLQIHNWSRCSSMVLPRCLFGSGSLAGIAVVAGGSDKNGCILKSAEMYEYEMGKWSSLPDMTVPRKMCSGFFMDGNFYVIGGMSNSTTCLTCGEEFNLQTRKWRRIENMYPVSNVGHPAMRSPPLVAVVNNQLYSADQTTNEVKIYDKATNTWRAVKRLPVRADSSNGWGLAFKACGDSLLVIGGHKGREVIILHSWNPQDGISDDGEWKILAVKERAGSFVYNCAVMGC